MLAAILAGLAQVRHALTREAIWALTLAFRGLRGIWNGGLRLVVEVLLFLAFVFGTALGIGLILSFTDEVQGHPFYFLWSGLALYGVMRIGGFLTHAVLQLANVLDGPGDHLGIPNRIRMFMHHTYEAVEMPYVVSLAVTLVATLVFTPKALLMITVLGAAWMLLARAGHKQTTLAAQMDAVQGQTAGAVPVEPRLAAARVDDFMRSHRFVKYLRFSVLGFAVLIAAVDAIVQFMAPGWLQENVLRTDKPNGRITVAPVEGGQPATGNNTVAELDKAGRLKYPVPVTKTDPLKGIGGSVTTMRTRYVTQAQLAAAMDEAQAAYQTCLATKKACDEPLPQLIYATLARWVIMPVWNKTTDSDGIEHAVLTLMLHDTWGQVKETDELRISYVDEQSKNAAPDFISQADKWLGVYFYKKATHQATLREYLTGIWNSGEADEQAAKDAIAAIQKTAIYAQMEKIVALETKLVTNGKVKYQGGKLVLKPGYKPEPEATPATWVKQQQQELGPWVFYPLAAPAAVLLAIGAIIAAIPVILIFGIPLFILWYLYSRAKGGKAAHAPAKAKDDHKPAAGGQAAAHG